MGHELVLDPDIRNWVLLPIVAIMVLVTLLRHFAQQLMTSAKPADAKQLALQNALARSQRLRGNGRFVAPSAFAMRRAYFNDADVGVLKQKKLPSAGGGGPMGGGNPMQMVEMMKANATYMFQNMFMITWITTFFSGFVLVKVPFPLTMRFKSMLQRGIDLGTLDPSYVSSLSWYFIVMFGLRGFLNLFIGGDGVSDETRMMQMQMGMVGGGGQMGFDAKKAFKQESEVLQLAEHNCRLDAVERSLVQAYRQGLPAGASPASA